MALGKSAWLSRLLALALTIVCIVLFLHNRDLAMRVDQLTTASFDAEIRSLQFALACPPDQIDANFQDWRALDETRLHFYQTAGFPPTESYSDVLAFVLWRNTSRLELRQTKPFADGGITEHDVALGILSSNGADHAWTATVFEACSNVAICLKSSTPLGEYLRLHPDIFNARLRPLLLRVMRAKSTWTASQAARALDAAGDRSAEFQAALKNILSRNFASEFGGIDVCLALDHFGDRSPEFRDGLLKVITAPFDNRPPSDNIPEDRRQAIALLKKCFPTTPVPPTVNVSRP
jgi:hypothetical protein